MSEVTQRKVHEAGLQGELVMTGVPRAVPPGQDDTPISDRTCLVGNLSNPAEPA